MLRDSTNLKINNHNPKIYEPASSLHIVRVFIRQAGQFTLSQGHVEIYSPQPSQYKINFKTHF
jgi:hypothetical protein